MSAAHCIVPGVFDILHSGHFNLLMHARALVGSQGRVIVVIDSDKRIRKTKTADGPIIPQDFRAANIRMLYRWDDEYGGGPLIDKVFIITTDEEFRSLIATECIDFIVKGSDWRDKPVLGSDLVPVHHYDVDSNGLGTKISSSKIIEMVLAKYNNEEDEQ